MSDLEWLFAYASTCAAQHLDLAERAELGLEGDKWESDSSRPWGAHHAYADMATLLLHAIEGEL